MAKSMKNSLVSVMKPGKTVASSNFVKMAVGASAFVCKQPRSAITLTTTVMAKSTTTLGRRVDQMLVHANSAVVDAPLDNGRSAVVGSLPNRKCEITSTMIAMETPMKT